MKDNFKKNFPNLDLPPNLGSICLMRRESGQLALPFRGDMAYCHQKNSKKSNLHNTVLSSPAIVWGFLLLFDYQSERHCSKTDCSVSPHNSLFDYQSERHCFKT